MMAKTENRERVVKPDEKRCETLEEQGEKEDKREAGREAQARI